MKLFGFSCRLGYFYRALASFARARTGGGMLISCAFALSLLLGMGATMSNYAWREAQWEEIRAAVRAAISATGPLLAGAGGALDEQIENRIAEFVEGLLPNLDLDEVTISHNEETGVTTVTVAGEYLFTNIWQTEGNESSREEIEHSTAARLEVDRYEVALALDISSSMNNTMPSGTPGVTVVRMDGLKSAVRRILDVVEAASASDPGSILVSVVPFGVAVNVADTCNPDPHSGRCRADHSAAKERYVRMLTGPHADTTAMLAAARAKGAHWVDTFHHYGAGEDLGPLWAQSLPSDLLDYGDWDLRREDVPIDVSKQAPNLDTGAGPGIWLVDDEDFWNGCVMGRWGAYWDDKARGLGWAPANTTVHWPARDSVPGWSGAASGLPPDTPLHLADLPPDADDPNTLFTAFSWPDARIGQSADHRLQRVMFDLLDPGDPWDVLSPASQGDNDWSVAADRGGASLCPRSPILPLTEDVNLLRTSIDSLEAIPRHGPFPQPVSGTYLNLGMVWALRALSPLWRDIWDVRDVATNTRPLVPCAPGEAAVGCAPDVHKAIVFISDGGNYFNVDSNLARRQLGQLPAAENADFYQDALSGCRTFFAPNYFAASEERSEDDFNSYFSSYVEPNGRFSPGNMEAVLDAFETPAALFTGTPPTPPRGYPPVGDAVRRNLWESTLAGATPWQIFRGIDRAGAIDQVLDEANQFGFAGRPVQLHHFCGYSSLFGAYGRLNDVVRAGRSEGDPATLEDPVYDAAPFSINFPFSRPKDVTLAFNSLLDQWLLEACRLAGERRVRVNAIFMGLATDTIGPGLLKECVEQAGSDPDTAMYKTPTAADLEAAFTDIFTIRRNLRFLE